MLVLYHAASFHMQPEGAHGAARERASDSTKCASISARRNSSSRTICKLNPNGVVPTLVDDGVPIIESSVICEYLDEKYPQNPLVPVRHRRRARKCAPGRTTSKRSPSAPSACRPSIAHFCIASSGLDQKQFESPGDQPPAGAQGAVPAHGLAEGLFQDRRSIARSAALRNLPAHGRSDRKTRPLADGRTIHAGRRSGHAKHRPHGRSRAASMLGGQISARWRMV